MNSISTIYNKLKNSIYGGAVLAALLLLIPLTLNILSGEFKWSVGDFIAAWILLAGAATAYKLVTGKGRGKMYKAASAIAIGTALFLIWANLAVGLIGSEDNQANILYMGVIAVGVIGSIISNLKPKGMSYTLYAAAAVQILVPFVAMIIFKPSMDTAEEVNGIMQVVGVTGFFSFLFVVSALLYRKAAQLNHDN